MDGGIMWLQAEFVCMCAHICLFVCVCVCVCVCVLKQARVHTEYKFSCGIWTVRTATRPQGTQEMEM